jgi:hypothetical protein
MNIFADTTLPNNYSIINNFFAGNNDSLFFVGVRHFYQGTLFSSVFVDGNFEDRYTEVVAIIPVHGEIGLIIQGDVNGVLDAFTFIYLSPIDRFVHADDEPLPCSLALRIHRYDILTEIRRARFTLMSFNDINSTFRHYRILN